MTQLRVMTYNIYQGGRRGVPLYRLVRDVHPDVLLVNETPKWPLVWRRQCLRLAQRWRMRFAGGGRKAGSNMITVAPGIEVKRVYAETFHEPLFQPRRGVVAAQLRVAGRLLGVVSCHLSLKRDRRAVEVERVIQAANTLCGPVVVAGDLNEEPDGPSWKRLENAGYVDPGSDEWLTFPAAHPTKRIDALLVRGAVEVEHHGDPGVPEDLQAAASDHRPVLAVLDV